MGADYYESTETRAHLREEGGIPIGVGEGTVLQVGSILSCCAPCFV